MKVKLILYIFELEKVIVMVVKLCYLLVGIDEIEKDLIDESIEKFLNMLLSIGYGLILEYVLFIFLIEGILRVCLY